MYAPVWTVTPQGVRVLSYSAGGRPHRLSAAWLVDRHGANSAGPVCLLGALKAYRGFNRDGQRLIPIA